MILILLSILSSTGIFVIFKIINNKQLPIVNIIVINYFVASLIGNLKNFNNPLSALNESWFGLACLIGILFIIFFFLIGLSSKNSGISLTTVASKMSVIIPILFSIFYYQESIITLKVIGIILALIGVFSTIYTKQDLSSKINFKSFSTLLILFIGMGVIDSLIKFTQESYHISSSKSAFFSSTLFAIAFLSGFIYTLIKKDSFKSYLNLNVIFFGILLGLANFGSIYFLIEALNTKILDSSIVFGINNVGIVVLSVLLGIILFKEKISNVNMIGVFISIIAILTLSFS